MPAPYRAIGEPTADRLENLRRVERSAWHTHIDAREAVALMSWQDAGISFARKRVAATKWAWVAALRELDAARAA